MVGSDEDSSVIENLYMVLLVPGGRRKGALNGEEDTEEYSEE